MNFINEILCNKRLNNADYHLEVGQAWRRYGESEKLHSPIVYSALEFRSAIERVVFELYALIDDIETIPDSELSKFNKYENIIKFILDSVGNKKSLYRALKFNSILYKEAMNLPGQLAMPDVGMLGNYWHKLSDYVHKQLRPDNTWESAEWVNKAYKLLNEVENYLWNLQRSNNFGWIPPNTMPPETFDLRTKFIAEEIDENSVKIRLNIMKPIIESRFK